MSFLTAPEPSARIWSVYRRVEILCDGSESVSGIPRELGISGARTRTGRLPVGDYLVAGRILVERKSASDFLRSLHDGRLYRQLGALSRGAPRPLLLIEGCAGFYEHFWPEALRYPLLVAVTSFRIPIVYTADPKGSALFLLELGRRCRVIDGGDGLRPSGSFGGSAVESAQAGPAQARMLAAIPGVGMLLATRLVERFGTFAGVFRADMHQLLSIEGIGEVRARAIFAALHEGAGSGGTPSS